MMDNYIKRYQREQLMYEPTPTDIAQLVLVRQTSYVSNFKEFFYTERVPLQLWGSCNSVFSITYKVLLVDTFLLSIGQVLPHGLDLIIQDWVK